LAERRFKEGRRYRRIPQARQTEIVGRRETLGNLQIGPMLRSDAPKGMALRAGESVSDWQVAAPSRKLRFYRP